MKDRRHHNNKGLRQIRRDKTHLQLKQICRKLKLPFGKKTTGADTAISAIPAKTSKDFRYIS